MLKSVISYRKSALSWWVLAVSILMSLSAIAGTPEFTVRQAKESVQTEQVHDSKPVASKVTAFKIKTATPYWAFHNFGSEKVIMLSQVHQHIALLTASRFDKTYNSRKIMLLHLPSMHTYAAKTPAADQSMRA